MIEKATADAYGESEQAAAWFTMIDENLAVPFETTVLEGGHGRTCPPERERSDCRRL
jgi:hypothetical protein